ncbi:MAG: class I SAM-dependent RNA methyltransferase [Treponema sp.]|jgi:23S rRNA (uracil1939-C5)-methyltransferase|nr:class I SAM-dependent RNA methyltransferase [Treponema sp.]
MGRRIEDTGHPAAGELFTATVEGMAAGGEGVLRREGKRVFMDLCAPGDTVTGRITERHRDWDRAELVAVETPSADRAAPSCPLFGRCGGCSLQHLSYEAQLRTKAVILQDAFIRIGGFDPPVPALIPSPPLEYRNRMQFHWIRQFPGLRSRAGGPGLRTRRGGEIVSLPDCPVADRGIREALRRGALRPPPHKDRFTVYSRQEILLCEGGRERGTIRLLDRDITLEAGCFFQSNGAVLELLIGDLLRAAEKADPALPAADLYCGVGTFAAFLGRRFSRIDLMERDRRALALARRNAEGGAEFFALGDDQWAALQKQGGEKNSAYGFVVADPPRKGLSPAMGRWLAESDCPLLAYVSCDPATLARDSRLLRAGGYRLAELRLYDFYPQTAHIESLALFRKDRRGDEKK